MGEELVEESAPVKPGLDDFYVAETIEGVTLNCSLCGQDLLLGYTLIFGDLLVAVNDHIQRGHQETQDPDDEALERIAALQQTDPPNRKTD